MEQRPLQDEGRVERFLQPKVFPCPPDAWVLPESLTTGREMEGLLGEVVDRRQLSMTTQMGGG